MSTQTLTRYDFLEKLPAGSTLLMHDRSWDDYEDILESVGENPGLRISYSGGTLQVMTLSSEHEEYSGIIHDLVRLVSLRLHIRVLSFGSTTIKKQRKETGTEPDDCFYVQTADVVAGRARIDFSTDPPPDVAVEIDLSHESISKFPIYAALGVPEIWRYDGESVTIYYLKEGRYVETPRSLALPIFTASILSEFLARSRGEQYETLVAFEEWLNKQQV